MEKPQASDEQLIQQIAAGNTNALGQIVDRYQGMALSLAFRNTQNWADAEDIAQEAFVRVFKAAGRYQGRSGFKTWLYRVVVNLCIDHSRKKKSNASLEHISAELPSKPEPDSLVKREIARFVQQAIQKLPQRQRMTLILHRYEGLTHKEISDATGWTQSAVESLLVRAYGNLRKKLHEFKSFSD